MLNRMKLEVVLSGETTCLSNCDCQVWILSPSLGAYFGKIQCMHPWFSLAVGRGECGYFCDNLWQYRKGQQSGSLECEKPQVHTSVMEKDIQLQGETNQLPLKGRGLSGAKGEINDETSASASGKKDLGANVTVVLLRQALCSLCISHTPYLPWVWEHWMKVMFKCTLSPEKFHMTLTEFPVERSAKFSALPQIIFYISHISTYIS